MKKYQSYKPSKIDWIGEIPTSWEVRKFRFLFVEKKSTQNLSLNSGSISFGQVIYKDDEGIPQERKETYQEVLKGEFLINPLNLNFDLKSLRIGLSEIDVVVSPGYIVLKLNQGLNKGYFKYLLRIFDTQQMKSLGNGVRQTISFKHLSSEELLLPPLQEQHQIAQYLDSKTELIDKLISTKERKITLLREQRISLINQIVTKGLNPNVKLKDSGVEWIGEIPEEWRIGRLGYYSNVYRGSGYQYINQVDDDFDGRKERVVRISDISEFNPIWCEYLEQFENYRIKKDEILMGGTGHYFGKSIYVTEEMEGLIHSYNIIRIVVKNLNTKYIQYYISSQKIREQMDMSVLGSGQPFIDLQGLKDLIILIPGNKEQYQIVEYLDSKTKEVDDMIQLEQKKIDLLKEYRQSLISEVVTGKIKVTE